MATTYPTDLDTWQHPAGGSVLGTSPDGRTHAQHHSDLNDVVLEVESQLLGPAFTSADAYAAVAESLILSCDSTTGFISVGGTSPALDTGVKTQGTASVKSTGLPVSFANNQSFSTKFYVNLASPATVGTYSHIAIDLRRNPASGTSDLELPECFYLAASASADLAAPVIASLPWGYDKAVWHTAYIPVRSLATVSSLGLVSFRYPDDVATLDATPTVWIDNIRFAAQSELDVAAENVDAVVVAPGYTPASSQRMLDLGDRTVVDLRSTGGIISDGGGIKHVRQFQLMAEDGSADVTAQLNSILEMLQPGDTLVFPPNATYQVTSEVVLHFLTSVTLEGRGTRLFRLVDTNDKFFRLQGCKNVTIRGFRIYGYRKDTYLGSTWTTVTGTPTVNGTGIELNAQYESARIPAGNRYARGVDDAVTAEITLSDSAHVADDCIIEFYDADSPTTAPTAVASGTTGPVGPGTRYYAVAFIDAEGEATQPSPSGVLTTTTGTDVTLTIPLAPVIDPTAQGVPWMGRRIFRTVAGAPDIPQAYQWVDDIFDNTTTTYIDRHRDGASPPGNSTEPSYTVLGAGNVEAGKHKWCVTFLYDISKDFVETVHGKLGAIHTVTTPSQIRMGLPTGPSGVIGRRLYRTVANGGGNSGGSFHLVATVMDNTTTTYDDNVPDASLGYSAPDQVAEIAPVILGRRTLTLTGTPTVYTLKARPATGLQATWQLRVSKRTATANTITAATASTYGRVSYNTNVEGSHGFTFGGGSSDILIEDCSVEGVGGDFATCGDESVSRVTIRKAFSRGCRRQGVSLTNGFNFTIENMRIWESARTAIDVEPTATQSVTGLVVRDIDIRGPGNYGLSLNNWHLIQSPLCERIRFHGRFSSIGSFLGGGTDAVVNDITSVWQQANFTGINMHIDGVVAKKIILAADDKEGPAGITPKVSGGYDIKNVSIPPWGFESALDVRGPYASVLTISANAKPLDNWPAKRVTTPFAFVDDTLYGIADPGVFRWRFPDTYKGIASGALWFPRGQDLMGEPVLEARALASTAVRGNNLAGQVSVAASAGSKVVTFPTHSYPNPTSFSLLSGIGGNTGDLANGTYYVRVAARPLYGGPVLALAEQNRAVTTGGYSIKINGLMQTTVQIRGLTIYRGTSTGVYNTRFDVIPNSDFHGMGALADDSTTLYDMGSLLYMHGSEDINQGYPLTFAPTAHVVTPDSYVPIDETGYEPDTGYRVFVQPSWQTTCIITKAIDKFTVTFGTNAPGGGGTLDWFIVR